MKQSVILLVVVMLAMVTVIALGERLGNLSSDSQVYTPSDDIDSPSVTTKDGYPVFEIVVPDGWTEIQIRATTRNFEPGFLVQQDGTFVLNYVPTGNTVNGRKEYQALGTDDVAQWDGSKWTFGHDNLQSTNNQVDPWDCTSFTSTSGDPYALQKEYFVYRTCTTGAAADPTWATGTSDADPWLYFNVQAPAETEGQYKRLKWNPATSLTSQLQPGGTPGRSVLFQPSRSVLGALEWMQENHLSLVWTYSFEGVAGSDEHPDGQRIWNDMRPVEWRKVRVELEP
ncbi:MAG: hypothetical protein O3A92_03655 [Verrucomicrobia bacterium]|nr:hypothetical protein [Verrucomicrobiota bacterium]